MQSQPLLMDLLDRSETSVPAHADPIGVQERVADTAKGVDATPLSETLDAIKRFPESVRGIVEKLGDELYRETFIDLLTQAAADPSSKGDVTRTPNMMSHSAKLAAFSAVSHASYSPWHLADAATLKAIAAELEQSGELECIGRHLAGRKPLNLFVAAGETDDRMSYLKSVASLVKRLPVRHLVLDAELVEWLPEGDFLEACSIVGLAPTSIGIAERDKVGLHSMMTPTAVPKGVGMAAVDTAGRRLQVGQDGKVEMAISAKASPGIAPASQPAHPAAAAQVAPPAATPSESPSVPTSALNERIRRLKESQVRRPRP